MGIHNLLRGAVQIASTGVVAKTSPQVQDLIDGRRSECFHLRKSRHEALVVGNHGRDLRLLQHDFRDPHAVGGEVALPGQMRAAMLREPLQNSGSEARRLRQFASRGHDRLF
jgi:hypothetical protein